IRLLRSKTLHAPRQQATTVAPLAPVSCSLPENDGHNLETSMANMRMQQTAPTAGNSNPTQPPKPPSVPASVFAVNASSVQPATWRAREMVLESLKQVVPLVNVGATRSPDRQLPDDADEQ
uniref:Uncharacterized protein n=1 Tax=Plectus sambesii TaxID=2011161 RepID=A0A914WL61_9BILA